MPAFHPIGFFLPLVVASLYILRAVPYLWSRTALYLAALSVVMYLLPNWNPQGNVGVGIAPLYVLMMWVQVLPDRTNPPRWWPERLPMGALLPYTFAAIAVPDILLTWQGGGEHWTVGGAGWRDGLVRFWLFAMPAFVLLRGLSDFGCARDKREPFVLQRWLSENLSPWPSAVLARSPVPG
jgi:hypothetical protein